MAAFDRILVTGGGGFVGGHMISALAAAYPRAQKVMLRRPGEYVGHTAFVAHEADLLDEASVDLVVSRFKPDLVVHLAGQASIGQAAQAKERTWRVNFQGSFGLGCAVKRHAPEAVVFFASTAAAYGLSFRDGVLTEEAPLRPVDVYSRSKAAAEGALDDVLGSDARLIVVRPVNHSGPGQRSRSFVLSSFAAQIAEIEAGRAEPLLRVGDLGKARDFLDVRDVVDAYMSLIIGARALPSRSVFNVSSGEAHSVQSLLEELRRMSKRDFAIDVDPALLRPATTDIASIACDASKLCRTTGWRPRHAVGSMLRAILDDWRAIEARGGALV